MQQIRNVAGDDIAGMTPTVTVPAMLSFQYGGNWVTRPVQLIGVDEKTQAEAGDFAISATSGKPQELQLRSASGRLRCRRSAPTSNPRDDLRPAGWKHRQQVIKRQRAFEMERQKLAPKKQVETARKIRSPPAAGTGQAGPQPAKAATAVDPFAVRPDAGRSFRPAQAAAHGRRARHGLATYRDRSGADRFLVLPGDDIKLTFPTAGTPPRGHGRCVHDRRFLRVQDERIRRQLRVRSARANCKLCGA